VASLFHTAKLVVVVVLFSYVDNFQAWILQRLTGFRKVEEGS